MSYLHGHRASLVFVVLAVSVSPAFSEEDADEKAYLAKRAAKTAAAEQTVKDLTRNYATLTADDWIRLAYAYNELGDNRLALNAICRVSDKVLAEKKQLDLKATCFHNVNYGQDKTNWIRELAFIDRCLDKKYGNQGVWLWRKARDLCQSSVTRASIIGGELSSDVIIDREQYEYSFELLERAFAAQPDLIELDYVGVDFLWGQDFPLLSDEPRFKELMNKSK